eukprot:7204512-Lingulodinium_polyedra.AAC.1
MPPRGVCPGCPALHSSPARTTAERPGSGPTGLGAAMLSAASEAGHRPASACRPWQHHAGRG